MALESTVRQPSRPLVGVPAITADAFRQWTLVLLAAVVAETLLLRIVTRIGVHLPKDGLVSGPFQAASFLGSLAFNLASLLAIALAALLLASAVLRQRNLLARAALAALSTTLMLGLALSLATNEPAADTAFGLAAALLAGAMLLTAAVRRETLVLSTLAIGLIVAAYLSYQYYSLGYLSYRLLDLAATPPASISALRLGEILALAASAAVFLAWGWPRRNSVGKAGLAAVAALVLVLTVASLAPASTTAILALWTTGLSLWLPFPLYLLAAALYMLTIVACWRSGNAWWIGAGLVLILLAGYMAESTYHHLLLLLGVAFVSGWADERPVRQAGPARSS